MRLRVVATTCPPLALEAFRMAIADLIKGKDVQEYMEVAAEFQKLAPNEPLAQINTEWVSGQAQRNTAETNRLEHELKTYKNNLIKESIRVSWHTFVDSIRQATSSQSATQEVSPKKGHQVWRS